MRSTEQPNAAPFGRPPAEPEAPEALELAGEFPAAGRAQWRELVAGVLGKAGRDGLPDPVEEALRRSGATGALPPLAGVRGLPPFVRGARAGAAGVTAAGGADAEVPAGWDVRQRHADPDLALTREAIAADL